MYEETEFDSWDAFYVFRSSVNYEILVL